ncbi:IS30 family transposase, partial [Lactobacillus sp. CC-MHH1034]
FLECHWSPEEIANRLVVEHHQLQISYNTIYRAIQNGTFDQQNQKATRKLRHRGKTRHAKGYVEKRGKIQISHTIHERPLAANDRTEIGHWELDTMAGKTGRACVVTVVDRKSRYTLIGKAAYKKASAVTEALLKLTSQLPIKLIKTITPDRGKEFTAHQEVTEKTGIEFYFPDAHAPWQRGTSENTNGLIREYLPKG